MKINGQELVAVLSQQDQRSWEPMLLYKTRLRFTCACADTMLRSMMMIFFGHYNYH